MSSYLVCPDISKNLEVLPKHPYSFSLDPFQQHAIVAISKDENVLVCAKTGSGKTLVGEYQIYHSLSKGKRVFYTTPIKSLSNQKFNDLKYLFKDASVGIMTGDIKFCPDAQIVIMTTEILRNLLYKKGTTTEHLGLTASISMDEVDAVIFDECHYINDKDRGKIWEETMILLPKHINMVMLSATLDHPEYLANWLGELKEKPIHLIETHYRIVPLTHYLVNKDYKLLTLMDEKENYHEKVYTDWLNTKHHLDDSARQFQQKVKDSRELGLKGSIDGKVHLSSFVYHLNETIKMLHKNELLPALFFVLSRKQCEAYAKKVELTLLDQADTSSVKHIISFHLHRHIKDLEKISQYHQIYDLLCRGIAFHHSGLLPILKEIIEILFSKGFVKLMFCTETFAVGLNMPTKTVLFAGFKKYDDQTNSMRILRNDEYLQMAGRAGRRGKDDKGVVIYLPDHEPIEPHMMYKMMKGSKQPIQSRMDFHYDFILKTIQASEPNHPLKWLQIMEKSYWLQQRKKEIIILQEELQNCEKKISELNLVEPYVSDCKKRSDLEHKIKSSSNATKKEIQRQLDALKNKQLGPKWNKAWADYQLYQALHKQHNEIKEELQQLKNYKDSIYPSVSFLHQLDYLKTSESMSITHNDLTLKGILATEINEGHPILLTELYTKELLHPLSGIDIISVLSCFHEEKESENTPYLSELNISQASYRVLEELQKISEDCKEVEDKVGYGIEGYWDLTTQMIEPMTRWIQGEEASTICNDYQIFEGNFIRTIMKTSNMLDELLSLASYCQHIEMINKITDIKQQLLRDIVIPDSLYLRL
jgi:superfamily II RNA helicase